jgi:hypothetical protein
MAEWQKGQKEFIAVAALPLQSVEISLDFYCTWVLNSCRSAWLRFYFLINADSVCGIGGDLTLFFLRHLSQSG